VVGRAHAAGAIELLVLRSALPLLPVLALAQRISVVESE
jgi:hypothetical protein